MAADTANGEDGNGAAAGGRRQRLVDLLLAAAEKVVGAEDAAEAEKRARALASIAAVAKTLREIDPKLAEGAADADEMRQFTEMRQAFDAEVERLIEERVQDRLRAHDHTG